MSLRAENSSQRSPLQRVAEQSAQEAQSAALKRQDTLRPADAPGPARAGVALPVNDHYTATKPTDAAAPPMRAEATVEQREQIRQRRHRRSAPSPLIGAPAAAPAPSAPAAPAAPTAPGVPQAPKPAGTVGVSTEFDDPFITPSHVQQMPKTDFTLDKTGKPVGLEGPAIKIVESRTFQGADQDGKPVTVANPFALPKPNAAGNFDFGKEVRFPTVTLQRGPDGKPVTKNGAQVWTPMDVHMGQSVAFESTNAVHHAAEKWSGQAIKWGDSKGQMSVDPHTFLGLNAFFNPTDRGLHFGMVLYKTPGSKDAKIFELASSPDVVRHESGHAVHAELKPNVNGNSLGFGQWGESFGDQMAMWSSLQDKDRATALVKQTGGDFSKPNDLAALGEFFGSLDSGNAGAPLRNANNSATTKNTTAEVHDRSAVLTGASYKLFQQVLADQKKTGLGDVDALQKSGEIMGQFLTQTCRYTPENDMTLTDVAKGYLSVDKEQFGGKYHDLLASEFEKRGLMTKKDLNDWQTHQANLPRFAFKGNDAGAMIQANLDKLVPSQDFGVKLKSVTPTDEGGQIVRMQLTDGRGAGAKDVGNVGVLVLRKDGSVADYQPALPEGLAPDQARQLFQDARAKGLDRHGAVTLAPKPDGAFTAQVVRDVDSAKDPHMQVYSLERPEGYRAEYQWKTDLEAEAQRLARGNGFNPLQKLLPPGAQIVSPQELAVLQGP